MSSKKRKQTDEEDGKKKIAFSQIEIEKHNYEIPKKREVIPPEGNLQHWFTFDSKHYYPIELELGGEKVIHPKEFLSCEIKHESYEPHVVKTKSKHGIYWFQQHFVHQAGSVTIRFYAEDDETLEPLVHRMEWYEKGQNRRKGAVATATTTSTPLIGNNSSSSSSSVLLLSPTALTHKNRIERPYPGVSSVSIRGMVLEIKALPSALLTALLDDQTRVATTKSSATPLLIRVSPIHSALSTSEVLTRTLTRAKTKGIPECDGPVLRLRQLFEYLFEGSLLYAEEKADANVQQQLNQIKSQRLTFAETCGAIYLLRLLVLVTAGADSLYDETSSSIGVEHISSTSLSDAAAAGTSHVARSSKERRQAVISNKHKIDFYRFQEVIDVCVRELDDTAHIAF